MRKLEKQSISKEYFAEESVHLSGEHKIIVTSFRSEYNATCHMLHSVR